MKKLLPHALLAIGLSGCATVDVVLPTASESALNYASSEIHTSTAPAQTYVSDESAERTVLEIFNRLRPASVEVCEYMGEDECWWKVQYSDNPEMNAYATGESKIVIHKGIVQYAESDDEIAMVIAHEISHHIADHLAEKQQNAMIGALLGAAVGAYISHGTYNPYSSYTPADMVSDSANIGASIGALSYSKREEREADYVAAYILDKAGYDLQKARNFLVAMAKVSGRQKSTFLDTHPAGAERLAAWDLTIKEIRSNAQGVPRKK